MYRLNSPKRWSSKYQETRRALGPEYLGKAPKDTENAMIIRPGFHGKIYLLSDMLGIETVKGFATANIMTLIYEDSTGKILITAMEDV